MEFANHVLNTYATESHTRSYRIDTGLMRQDCDFASGARLTSDVLDLHNSIENLRNLSLKKPPDEIGMGAGCDNLRAADGPGYLNDVDLDLVARPVSLRRNLFSRRHDRLCATDIKHDASCVAPLDGHGEDLTGFVFKLIEDDLTLGFTQSLHDHLFRGLRGDSTGVLRNGPGDNVLTNSRRRINLFGVGQVHHGVRFFHLGVVFYDGPDGVNLHLPGIRVK